MLKKFFTIVLTLVFFACKGPVPEPQPQGPSQDPSGEVSPDPSGLEGSEDPQSEDPSAEPESVDPNYIAPTDTVREKPMVMWIDASANFRRFEKQSDIKATLKKARKARDGAGIAKAHMAALKAGLVWDKSIKGYRKPVVKAP